VIAGDTQELSSHANRRAVPLRVSASGEWERLAQHAVEAAVAAGAQYADVRLTRTVVEDYDFTRFAATSEQTGVGVRVVVNGAWGFCAGPHADADTVTLLAKRAVAQARTNARAVVRPVELGKSKIITGTWATPIARDPFGMSIEEKTDATNAWRSTLEYLGWTLIAGTFIHLVRQEQVFASSEGSRYTQTLYESGGKMVFTDEPYAPVIRVTPAGAGWELFEREIPAQIPAYVDRVLAYQQLQAASRPILIGRKTIVCDGSTMAALADRTLGVATQLDRAMGLEANASGTSFLDDPLAMLGQLSVAAPAITLTADRSAPGKLATVQWDAEGQAPQPFTLVKQGILTDFQTTREQAAWLAPYYERTQKPVVSNGCASVENALFTPLQQTPNLTVAPAQNVSLDDLIGTVPDGVFITQGRVSTDCQGRTGFVEGYMREIKNGRLGRALNGGALIFNAGELWKQVSALGGAATQEVRGYSKSLDFSEWNELALRKGQPSQLSGHSVTAPAAIFANQAIIDRTKQA